MKPVVVYGIETWPITEMDTKRMNTWRMRTYQESWKLHKDLDIIGDIRKREIVIKMSIKGSGQKRGGVCNYCGQSSQRAVQPRNE